ncbi:Poly-U binding splicing factor, half-pint family [Aphelenchoides bicaudatus]|nr:Poly-U binding splicing factor, half-pint family [Aphelenchoides bicaudatus]
MATATMINNVGNVPAGPSIPLPQTTIPAATMPFRQQAGEVFVGPGAKAEAMIIGLGLSKLTSRQKEDLEAAKNHAMEQSIQFVLKKRQTEQQKSQQKMARYTQALSLMSRLYVGSISLEVHEETLRQMFEVYGPVKSLNMCFDTASGRRKGFAFVEYDVPEAALLALKFMDGRSIGGRTLTVRPPTNMTAQQAAVDSVMEDAKTNTRIYVASVNPEISETDLKTIFQSFGEILSVQLAKQHSGQGHRGFGYIEFSDLNSVKSAITGMVGLNLGGQILQVGNCVTPQDALSYVIPNGGVGVNSPLIPMATTAAYLALPDFGPATGSHGILAADVPDSAFHGS